MNSTVFEMIIRVFGAFLSIYSFAILLQVPRRFVLQAGIVGAIGGFVYLLAIHLGSGDLYIQQLQLRLFRIFLREFIRHRLRCF